MNFSYLKITSQISRPIIPIILKSESNFIIYSGLIDSGSDYCVFDTSIAEILGIKLKDSDSINIQGISGDLMKCKQGEISLKLGQKSYKIKGIFQILANLAIVF